MTPNTMKHRNRMAGLATACLLGAALTAAAGNVVSVDSHNRLIVNGRPFFPLGTYWNAVGTSDLDTYAAANSFNCLVSYNYGLNPSDLDQIAARGLMLIYSLKDFYDNVPGITPPSSIADLATEYTVVANKVNAYKNHSALLGWYLYDEIPPSYAWRAAMHRQWLQTLDPNHVTWGVNMHPDQFGAYLDASDVLGGDPYPVPARPLSIVGTGTRSAVQSSGNSKAVWMVPQMFNPKIYGDPNGRFPTVQELRCMAWQAIAGGANGLIFYSFYDLKRDPDASFNQRWNDVKVVASEIRGRFTILLSAEPPVAPSSTQSPDTVFWRTYSYAGSTYLVVVNGDSAIASASFVFPVPFRQGQVLMGTNNTTLAPFEVTVPLAGYEVKIVRLTALAGDANADDRVTFEDFSIVQNHYGQTGKTWTQGDFTNDGRVAFDDFALLQNNYGQSNPAGAALAGDPATEAIGAGLPCSAPALIVVLSMGLGFLRPSSLRVS